MKANIPPKTSPASARLGPTTIDEAVAHLCQVDPRLAQLIERVGPCALKLRHEHSIFYSRLRSIVYQQLAGTAAAILARVNALFPTALRNTRSTS